MLDPPSKNSISGIDSQLKKDLDEIDKQNNNYLKSHNEKDETDSAKVDDQQQVRQRVVKKNEDKSEKREFELGDIVEFVQRGMQTIIDDEVTKRFTTEELAVWNLLSRTNQQYEYVSFRVTVLWILGFFVRYCFLFPFR